METGTSPHTQEVLMEKSAALPEMQAYSFWKKAFILLVIAGFVMIFLFLVYQNGKSIYVNGL